MVWADRRPATQPQTRPRRKSWYLRTLIPTPTLWALSFRKGRVQGGYPSPMSSKEVVKMDWKQEQRDRDDRDDCRRRQQQQQQRDDDARRRRGQSRNVWTYHWGHNYVNGGRGKYEYHYGPNQG